MIYLNTFTFRFMLFGIACFPFFKRIEATHSFLADTSESSEVQEVWSACVNNNIEKLKTLLYKKSPIDYTNIEKTGFQWACFYGHKDIVELFLNTQYYKDALQKQCPLALYEACNRSKLSIIELLLEKEVNIDYIAPMTHCTSFQSACSLERNKMVQLFFNASYCKEVLQKQLSKALYEACCQNKLSLVKLLLKKKTKINSIDSNERTGFQCACYLGYKKIVSSFFNASYCKKALEQQLSGAVYDACNGKQCSIVKLLLTRKLSNYHFYETYDYKGFQLACHKGDLSIVKLFLQYNIKIKQRIKKQLLPIEESCKKHHTALPTDILRLIGSFVHDFLILEKRNEMGETALHLTTLKGHDQVVQLLLEHGFDPMVLNNKGKTPLMLAKNQPNIKRMMLHFLS